MTIAEAIVWLSDLQRKYGPTTKVYFDCPECKKSFTPDIAEAEVQVIHQKGKQQ